MLAVFDWDGTLMDSTQKIVGCMQKAAKSLGLPVLEPASIQNIIGLGLPEAIARLYPDLPAHWAEPLRQQYAHQYVTLDATPTPFFDGVEDGLAQLQARGVPMAVATGKSRKGLDRVLAQVNMAQLFCATRCADETASKPNPLMLQDLLAHSGLQAAQAVMVGDTEYDLAMANAIAMPAIAVGYGAHAPERLTPYNPLLCTQDFNAVVQCILQRYSGYKNHG